MVVVARCFAMTVILGFATQSLIAVVVIFLSTYRSHEVDSSLHF